MYIKKLSPSKSFRIDIYSPAAILLLIIITGFILRLYRLNFRSLNFDEANSIAFARNSLIYIIKNTPLSIGDLHPPLFHILFHFWMLIGETEFWARLFSVICGTTVIYITYLIGRHLFTLRTAILGAFLVMVSSFHILYSQEARMYPLFTLLTVLSIYFFIKAIDTGLKKYWLRFTIFSILNIYTHYVAFFILFAEASFFILDWKGNSHLRSLFIMSIIAITLSFLPWIPTVFNQFTAGDGQLSKELSLGTGLIIPYSLFVFSVGETFIQIKSIKDVVPNMPLIILTAVIFVIPIFNSAVKQRERRLLFIILVPIFTLYLVSWKIPRILNSVKYVIAASPLYYLLLAHGLTSIGKRYYQIAFAILITFFNIVSLRNYHYDERFKPEDWRGVAKYISERFNGNDIILFDAGHIQVVFDYYCKCEAKKIRLNPKTTGDRGEAFKNIEKEIASYKNIWLILSHNWKTGDYYKRLLDDYLPISSDYRSKGIEVYKYTSAVTTNST